MGAEDLLKAIIADPDDDGPRLAYSDLLEERGDAERAEFIRVQCALAGMEQGDDRWIDLEIRERELLSKHKNRWLQEDLPDPIWRPYSGFWHFQYRRGFVETIGAGPNVLYKARSILRRVPFRDLDTNFGYTGRRVKDLFELLARWPFPIPLDRLRLTSGCWNRFEIEKLCGLSSPSRLTALQLVYVDSSDLYNDWDTPGPTGWLGPPLEALEVLAGSPHLAGLKWLGFDKIPLGPSARVLLDSPTLTGLEHLHFHGHPLDPVTLREIFGSAGAARLTSLDLRGCWIRPEGLRELIASPHLSGLRRLELAGNALGDVALADLARWPGLAGVRFLGLDHNGIGDAGLRALADSPHGSHLESLDLTSHPHLTDAGLRALAASPHLARLRRLSPCPGFMALRQSATIP